MADGKVVIETDLDTKDFVRGSNDLKREAAKLAAEYRKMGMSQSEAMKKAWSEIDRSSKVSTDNAKRHLSGLNSAIKDVMKNIASFAIYEGGKKLAEGFIQATKAGIEYNASLETSQIAWTTLLGTQEKANKMLKDIESFAATTPFEKMGVDNMAKQLHNAGFEGQALFDQLTKFGDIGGAFGIQAASLEEMVRQYSQVKQAGVAYTEDLNILQDRGVPIYKALAQELGINVSEVKKWASEGKISADIYQAALDNVAKSVEGGMAKQSKSFSGMLSTLKDSFSQVAGILAQPIFEALKNAMTELQPIIDAVVQSLSENGLRGTIEKFAPALLPFVDALKSAGNLLLEFGKFCIDNIETIGLLASTVSAGVLAFKGFSIIRNISKAFGDSKTKITEFMLASEGATIAQGLLNGKLALNDVIVGLLSGKLSLATVATNLWTAATGALSKVMTFLGGPIGLIVIAIAALTAGIVYLWNTNEGFRDAVLKAWDKICKFFTDTIPAAFNKVIDFVKNNWQGLLLFIVNPFVGAFKLLYDNCESFRNFINNIWDKILEKIHEWGENIRSFFNETIPGWIESFKEWWNGLPEYFAQLWENVKAKFIEWGTNISNFFTETIPGWIESIRAWFNELPYKIGEALGFALGTIYQWGVNTYNYFATNIPLWIESISTWFSEMPGKVWTWLCDCFNKVKEWGMNVYNSFSASVTSTVEAVSIWFSEMPGKVWNWLNDCINKIKDWGSQTYNNAKDAAQRAIDAVSQWFSQMPGRVWSWLSNVIDKVRQWGSDMVEKGRKAANDTVNKVVDGFKNLPNKIKQKGKEVVEGLWNGIVGMKDWLWGKITGFCGGIVDGFKKALRINSPSKIMRDKIGVGIVEGIDVGIDKEMPNLDKNIDYNMNEMTSKMQRAIKSEQVNVASTFSLKGNYEVNQNNNDTEIVSILTSIMKDIKNIDPKIFLDSKELILSKIEMIKEGLNDSEQRNPKFI